MKDEVVSEACYTPCPPIGELDGMLTEREALELEIIELEKEVAERERVKVAKEGELKTTLEEDVVARKAAEQAQKVKAQLEKLLEDGNNQPRGRMREVSKPTTCQELLKMTKDMIDAFAQNTMEGFVNGAEIASAILEEPVPICTDEDKEDIREAATATSDSVDSIQKVVVEKQKAIEEKTIHLKAATTAVEGKREELNLKIAELEKTKEALNLEVFL